MLIIERGAFIVLNDERCIKTRSFFNSKFEPFIKIYTRNLLKLLCEIQYSIFKNDAVNGTVCAQIFVLKAELCME